MSGRLVVCPTPIGNLEDVTLRVLSALRDADVVVLSGSLPPGVPQDAYAVLIAAARGAGVASVLDADGPALPMARQMVKGPQAGQRYSYSVIDSLLQKYFL